MRSILVSIAGFTLVPLLLLGLGAAQLAACKKAPPAVEASKDPGVKKLQDLADATCACTDYACAAAATKEIFAMMGKIIDGRGVKADGDAARAAIQRAAECKAKLPKPAAAPPPPGATAATVDAGVPVPH